MHMQRTAWTCLLRVFMMRAACECVMSHACLSHVHVTRISYYLDGIVSEINDSLTDAGQLSIVSLAQRFQLPAVFIRTACEQRMGTIIQGAEGGKWQIERVAWHVRIMSCSMSTHYICSHAYMHMLFTGYLEGDSLYTASFIARHHARLRGRMLALTQPTPTRTIVTQGGFLETITYRE